MEMLADICRSLSTSLLFSPSIELRDFSIIRAHLFWPWVDRVIPMREGSVDVEEWKSVESGVEGKRVMGEIT